MDLIIADTSPLIFLSKLALLETVCTNFRLITTETVFCEATRKKDLPDSKYIARLKEDGKITIQYINAVSIKKYSDEWKFGQGEASAFALVQNTGGVLLVDDFAAIRCARALDIKYITTPVLIYTLSERNILTQVQARDKLLVLKEYSWISQEILDVVVSWFQ